MKGAVTALLLILPTLARAESPSSQGFSFFSSLIQMVAALAIVVGLILLTRHFTAKLAGGPAARLAPKHIRVLETRYIAPKKSLLLVEVGGEYLLLASTEDGLSLIKQVNVIEEIEVLEEAKDAGSDVFSLFRRAAARRRG